MSERVGMHMDVVLTTEDADGNQIHSKRDIELTVDDQRKLVEREAGGPCFRMWITADERKQMDVPDWSCYRLSDGRFALWRKESSLQDLRTGGAYMVASRIDERRLRDDE